MSVMLPCGRNLGEINLEDPKELKELLSYDKYQMLEGINIEGLFKKYFDGLSRYGISMLDIDLVKSSSIPTKKGFIQRPPVWWLWNRSSALEPIERFHGQLETSRRDYVLHCSYDENEREFYFTRPRGGTLPGESVQQYMMRQRKWEDLDYFPSPDHDVVKDKGRLDQLWDSFHKTFPGTLYQDAIIPRIFKNFVVQPFFKWVWDVDNVALIPNGSFMQFEVKHKFPGGPDHELYFGLNNGQINLVNELCDKGIDTLHVIIVKPDWDDETGTEYLTNDGVQKRDNALIVARRIDKKRALQIIASRTYESPIKTSKDGKGVLKFKKLFVGDFNVIGKLTDNEQTLIENIKRAALGEPLEALTPERLISNRLSQARKQRKFSDA